MGLGSSHSWAPSADESKGKGRIEDNPIRTEPRITVFPNQVELRTIETRASTLIFNYQDKITTRLCTVIQLKRLSYLWEYTHSLSQSVSI